MKIIIPKGRKTPSGREKNLRRAFPRGKGVMLPCTAFAIATDFAVASALAFAVSTDKLYIEEFEEYR